MSRRFWEGPGLVLLFLGFLLGAGLVLWGYATGSGAVELRLRDLDRARIRVVRVERPTAMVEPHLPSLRFLDWPIRIIGLVGGAMFVVIGVGRIVVG